MNRLCCFMLIILLSGCVAQQPKEYQLDTRRQSVSYDQRIKIVVLHYTDENLADSLRILTKGPVSSHYLVSDQLNNSLDNVTIYQLVPESKRAWHAGRSYWGGRTNINDSSIGIEIVNSGYRPNADGIRE